MRKCKVNRYFLNKFQISILSNALNRSNYQIHTTLVQLFLSYHLIQVPLPGVYIYIYMVALELLPSGIPPRKLRPPGSLPRNSSHTGSLPRNSSQNGIPPKAGFLPKRDSSQNGIPPETGFLPKRDSSRKKKSPPIPGGIPFWEESHFGRNPVWEEFHGRDPGREEFCGRDPGQEESCFSPV